MADIALLGQFCLQSVLEEHGLSDYQVIDSVICNDDSICFLLAETVPEREQGMFVPTKSNTRYRALSVIVDWQAGELLHKEVVDFGMQEMNLHFIQRLHDGYLLLGSRCARYKDGTTDKNALIAAPDGRVLNRFCFGDGIEQCMVDHENRIITSYFDEGVFGNYGWDNPVGSSGLILWSDQGEVIWENKKHDICDCYGINLDQHDNLWFYYYTEFNLVKTDYISETVWDPQLSGSSCFLIHQHGQAFLFQKGYGKEGQFVVKRIAGDRIAGERLSKGEPVKFTYCGKKAAVAAASFRSSKALFWGKDDMLYFTDWNGAV